MENGKISSENKGKDYSNGHAHTITDKPDFGDVKTSAGDGSSGPKKIRVKRSVPRRRLDVLKWHGYGYDDSKIMYCEDQGGYIYFTGERYESMVGKIYPHVHVLKEMFNLPEFPKKKVNNPHPPTEYAEPILQKEFLEYIEELKIIYSTEGFDRMYRSHGQSAWDNIACVNYEKHFHRYPDAVVWPNSHEEVEKIVKAAVKYNVVIIPYGGGTNVSLALMVPVEEKRMVVSLDLSEMCHILRIDEENLTVTVEAGVIGLDLENELQQRNFTVGHQPDSVELSTVGGWVATRASGMKKNGYGNIEDLVIDMKAVTPKGIVEKKSTGPRISAGPDIYHFLLGSEGILGVITEVTLKMRPLPPVRRFGSLAFPDFESGLAFLREVAYHRCQPPSLRLMDNKQYKGGDLLRSGGLYQKCRRMVERLFLTYVKGYDMDKISIVTLLFEGEADEVNWQEKKVYGIAYKYGGVDGGSDNGERGYQLTFLIGYIRDFLVEHGIVGESMETSCPWDKALPLCRKVAARHEKECHGLKIFNCRSSCRVSQVYDTGVCIYIYINWVYDPNLEDAIEKFDYLMACTREEILANGGNISHHHGIGKKRKKFMRDSFSPAAIESIEKIKEYFDPSSNFAMNIIPD